MTWASKRLFNDTALSEHRLRPLSANHWALVRRCFLLVSCKAWVSRRSCQGWPLAAWKGRWMGQEMPWACSSVLYLSHFSPQCGTRARRSGDCGA